jgi:hypothetical protein
MLALKNLLPSGCYRAEAGQVGACASPASQAAVKFAVDADESQAAARVARGQVEGPTYTPLEQISGAL